MTRIIAGVAGGRRLVTPAGQETRPTSDRVREALFSRLDARGAVEGARVLDLFAGSGALGLEAVSRGAAGATFVDSSRHAVTAVRRNVAAVVPDGVRVEIVQATVARYLARPDAGPFGLVFLDPPYGLGEEELAGHLSALAGPGLLADDAVVVVERGSRSPEPCWPADWVADEGRRYGETTVWTALRAAVPEGNGGPDGH